MKPLFHLLRCWLLIAAAVAPLAVPLAARAQQLTVSAAASLTDAFKEIAPRFEALHPGATLRLNFAASGLLLQQIAQGAPADVFASADQETADRGVQQKLLDADTRRDFAANTLVLIVPVDATRQPTQPPAGTPAAVSAVPTVASVADLAGPAARRIAIGKTATVPVGRYTQQALEAAGLWAALQPKLVQADSVRQVLDYVARGEAEAGFVYRTDAALMADKVRIVQTASGHAPVRYPVAVVSDSRNKPLARQFAQFLVGAEAQAVLAKFGFGKP